ncbi:MAG: energy-coupling factor ABC transporter ATP-binding protein [Candidatus Nezhaarchaeales archaeon]
MKLIELRKVTFTYRGEKKPALINIDLEVKEGEALCIMGPSGSGKSTLCYCLAGLIPTLIEGRLEGSILFRGNDITRIKKEAGYIGIGLVLQEAESQIITLSVERELAFGPENLGLPKNVIKEKIQEAAESLGITHLLQRDTHKLSGGELQRVVIASMLTLDPKIIILDEPTANLDFKGIQALRSILIELKKKKYTLIVVEHDVEHMVDIFDRIVVLHQGRKILDGDPISVLTSDDVQTLGISIPSFIDFYKRLKDVNIVLPKPPLSIEELISMIGDNLWRNSLN